MLDPLGAFYIFSAKYQNHLQNTYDHNLNISSNKTTGYYLSLALMSYQGFLILLINISRFCRFKFHMNAPLYWMIFYILLYLCKLIFSIIFLILIPCSKLKLVIHLRSIYIELLDSSI